MDKETKYLKYRCKNSLLFFTQYFIQQIHGTKFIKNWHHETICQELEKAANYETLFLNINIPPRFSKTELAAINFIAWGLAKNPKANYLYITASDELRSEVSTRIRDIVNSDLFREMFGVELKKDQKAKNLWRTTQGGGLKTATIFGQITGFGAGKMIDHEAYQDEMEDYIRDFDGCIVLDDINKIDDAENLNANNTKTKRVIFNTILSRKNSKDTPLINIQQRSGVEDATAVLLNYYKDDEKIVNLVMPIISGDKLLWENKIDLKEIERLKKSDETAHVFDCQYMQDPSPKSGLMFPREELSFFTMPELEKMIQEKEKELTGIVDKEELRQQAKNELIQLKCVYIDPADTGEDDYAAPFAYIIGNKAYIVDVIYNKNDLTKNQPLTIEKCKYHDVDRLWIETNKEGTTLKGNYKEALPNVHIRGRHNSTNKHTRIDNSKMFVVNHIMFRSDIQPGSEYDRYMSNVTKYPKIKPKNGHDDGADSTAGLAKELHLNFRHLFA